MSHATLLIPVAAALLAAAPAPAQTRPAAAAPKVTVWSCPEHEQFRLTTKGTCPACTQELVRRKVEMARDPYPLATCPVSGLELGEKGPPVAMMHEGREIRFCCTRCIERFQADPSGYLEKIDAKIIEQQLPLYPMTTCPVSGEPLGSMGEPVNLVYNNRLVRFCCKGCLRGFRKSPDEHLATLDQAVIAAGTPRYPMTTCLISGEPLDAMGGPVDLVVANRLVRFCCNGCVTAFNKAPGAHLAALAKASPKRQPAHEEDHDHGHDHDGHDHDH